MELIIDRFEGDYAVLEIEIGKTVSIPRILIPNAKEGDVINISVNKAKTKERENNINKLVDELFED